jgi:hypothetical protein
MGALAALAPEAVASAAVASASPEGASGEAPGGQEPSREVPLETAPGATEDDRPRPIPPPSIRTSVLPQERGTRPWVLVLAGAVTMALVASATYVLLDNEPRPVPIVASVPGSEEPWRGLTEAQREDLRASALAWSAALLHRQQADGSFAAVPGASPSGGDTGQQFLALLSAQRVSVPLDSAIQLQALAALDHFRQAGGWTGMSSDGRESAPSTVATAWATLAYTRFAAQTRAEQARQRADAAREVLLSTQFSDGSFPAGAGPEHAPMASTYATVLTLWALVELEAVEREATTTGTSERARLSRQRALGWVRAALLSPTPRVELEPPLQAIPGLAEMALWVYTRARRVTREAHTQDPEVVRAAARALLEHCNWNSAARGGCASRGDGHVPLRFTALDAREQTTPWQPWALLAAAELLREPSPALEPDARGVLSGLVRGVLARYDTERGSFSAEAPFRLAEHLLAATLVIE